YAGVRPLIDDGAEKASKATRDYTLKLETAQGAPLLNIFGGKITTYRKLAEEVLAELIKVMPKMTGIWTAGVPLPGGDFPVDGYDALCNRLADANPDIPLKQVRRLVRAYGTEAERILEQIAKNDEQATDFGHGLSVAEVRHLMTEEWAMTADDVLWRRSKLGLLFQPDQVDRLQTWMQAAASDNRDVAAE
ncbi:MAG: glycerol-3-phosphate dehydrogenase C-terminal domain-containing protein, partial [Pseudomonadota bacterium]